MKIYSIAPEGNEAADLENARYFNLALKQINSSAEYLKTSDSPVQVMLVHIDILLLLSRKYPNDANLSIKRAEVKQWKESFYGWFERCGGKINVKYRQGIKDSADALFSELDQYGH
ncbi:hypothetical protein SAMN05518672_11532 [Chitinophaga sp. CF118]|uniref:hypothetical protein n=1 Tax=Chitinophaga sp. CF118 TaxID=1884367 RepID=UPI0008F04AF2|nr:hypothetical protein [Chitinophaga sp. CF118]SFF06467.1 hypothetical protein SAMN05518672_11532 [Chitinophaga sp. CF118]